MEDGSQTEKEKSDLAVLTDSSNKQESEGATEDKTALVENQDGENPNKAKGDTENSDDKPKKDYFRWVLFYYAYTCK